MATWQPYSVMSFSPPPAPAEVNKITEDSQIILEVGERRFVTTAPTLTRESGYFAALLSSRRGKVEADKPYFVDIDGDVFEHTLRYLRNGVFPVFYEKSKGYDYGLYTMLLEQARRLLIPRLGTWIEEKGYLQAITVTTSIKQVDLEHMVSEKTATNVDVEYRCEYRTKKVYLCPRRILAHRGNAGNCEKACAQAWQGSEIDYEDEDVVKVLKIRRKINFHQEICLDPGKTKSLKWLTPLGIADIG